MPNDPLVYLQVRRPPPREPRTELYHSLDAIEDVLDRDLDEHERDELDKRLLWISDQAELFPDLASLASELHHFLHNQDVFVIPDKPTLVERWMGWIEIWASRHIHRTRLRIVIIFGLGFTGIVALAKWIVVLRYSFSSVPLHQTLIDMAAASSVDASASLYWFYARLVLEGIVGMALLTGSILITAKQVRRGMNIGYYGLLLSLSTVDLLLFYFDQFSTILIALLQFTVLMGMIYYRKGIPRGISGP